MSIRINEILRELNQQGVNHLLIGGMNFMLRHEPKLTFDVDVWIEDTPENRRRCEVALAALDAQWGRTDEQWGPVANLPAGWLDQQHVFSVLTAYGALDVFRSVQGLKDWHTCWQSGVDEITKEKTPYRGLSDDDMLQCQLALSEGEQKQERIRALLRRNFKTAQPSMTDDLKQREEAKRDRCWDPRDRWRMIEETIEWVDSQQPVPRNSRPGCLANQQRLLGGSVVHAQRGDAKTDTHVD